jgi:hypothetical protein
MATQLSRGLARRLLARYHFTPTDLPSVFVRLGTALYDPLNPAGRNPDLVLQARAWLSRGRLAGAAHRPAPSLRRMGQAGFADHCARRSYDLLAFRDR